jgi:NhaP-type Na+/H+ or K+/H+ antiporter
MEFVPYLPLVALAAIWAVQLAFRRRGRGGAANLLLLVAAISAVVVGVATDTLKPGVPWRVSASLGAVLGCVLLALVMWRTHSRAAPGEEGSNHVP